MTIMDLTKITDLKELKSLAYDQLIARNVADQNLAAINTWIEQVASQPVERKEVSATKAN